MIQRKQTLFLLAAFILLTMQIFSPLTTIVCNIQNIEQIVSETIELKPFGIESITLGSLNNPISIYYGGMLIVAALLSLVAIFLFKNRPLQMRITIFALFATIITIGLEGYYIYSTIQTVETIAIEQSSTYSMIAFTPILDIILLAMAHRLILKDEVLVRSNERFR